MAAVYHHQRRALLLSLPEVLRRSGEREALTEALGAVRVSVTRFSKRPGLRIYLPSGYRLDVRYEGNSDFGASHWWETELRLWYRPLKVFFAAVSPENDRTRGRPDWRCGDPALDGRYHFRSRQPEVLEALFADVRFRELFAAEEAPLLLRALREHRLLARDHLPRHVGALSLRARTEWGTAAELAPRVGMLLRAAQVWQGRRWVAPPYDAEGHKAW
jgi:hypothetical protein